MIMKKIHFSIKRLKRKYRIERVQRSLDRRKKIENKNLKYENQDLKK